MCAIVNALFYSVLIIQLRRVFFIKKDTHIFKIYTKSIISKRDKQNFKWLYDPISINKLYLYNNIVNTQLGTVTV